MLIVASPLDLPAHKTYGWLSDLSVRDGLHAQGYRFEFLQAVRLLEQIERLRAAQDNRPVLAPLGESPNPHRESLRLRAAITFSFPAQEISHLEPGDEADSRTAVVTNFFSLAGGNAPLPDWVADLLLEQQRNHDTGLRDFLDLFHHRLLSMLYRVRLQYRPWLDPALHAAACKDGETGELRARNRMAGYLLSFAGLGLTELQNRLGIGDEQVLPYAGLLWQRPRSMRGLERILEHAFAVPLASREMIGVWRSIEPEDRTRLGCGNKLSRPTAGSRNNALGQTAVLGARYWDPQGQFELVLGPLRLAQFENFLPGAEAYTKLRALIRFYAGDFFLIRVRLLLEAQETPPTRLGSARLGWTSWLKTRPVSRVRAITIDA